ncbi:dolichyl-P-Man:Man(7)GlcNAc(2)-PP-dolichol alpha-1,6-mannosyltransferase [Rhodotorula paludigena]|uniref:dolichyl-P-Man:Man(7)GlcNAc(2)-PP-dolichol alpha-1,6-mannosyltransferase n=1 Tax=Rhodotorula paludigena TaxID=86838 RepID=UPI00317DE5C5
MRVHVRGYEALLVLVFAAHVVLVPPTKVEESFTLHAARDLVVHGVDPQQLEQFDHLEFAGAVPRSFVAPLALSALAALPVRWAASCGWIKSGLEVQIAVRLTLAVVSALSLVFFSRCVRAAYGAKVAKYFALLAATQFHVPFWAGRTLPNMLAVPLVQVALGLLVCPPGLSSVVKPRRATRHHLLAAFALLTFAATVIRLELVALVVPFALEHLARGLVGLGELVFAGALSGAGSLALSAAVDTHFCRSSTWLWPEGQAFLFNVVKGKSEDWGVSPPLYYFTSAIPKLLHLSLAPATFSLFADRRTRRLLLPCLAFVALLSGLKHKEWRFVAYVVPAFNAAAAAGIVAIGSLTSSRLLRRTLLVSLLALNLLFTFLGLLASTHNYPGFSAVTFLSSHLASARGPKSAQAVRVHVGTAAKMSGASNFVLLDSPHTAPEHAAWYLPQSVRNGAGKTAQAVQPVVAFDRSEVEGRSLASLEREGFDYALVDAGEAQLGEEPGVEVLYESGEFAGFDRRRLASGSWRDAVRTTPRVKVVRFAKNDKVV